MRFQIEFMRQRRVAVTLSVVLVIGSIAAVAWRGLEFGLDFTGGTLIEVRLAQPVPPERIREALSQAGFGTAVVQNLGSERDILVRVPPGTNDEQRLPGDVLAQAFPGAEMRRTEFVGPVVGEELRDQGGLALLVALGVIAIYIMWRFTGKFAAAAVLALIHDVVITVGAFAVFRWSVDLSTVAALMTVIGYSLNDTIVICDRIRENVRALRRREIIDVIDISLNQTLERTIIMAGTTLMVLLGMLIFGGGQLRGFSIALTIGVFVGTYSSIYVAAAWLVFAGLSRADLMLPEPENMAAKDTDAPRKDRRVGE